MKFSPMMLGLSLAVAGALPAAAQDSSANATPPKYMQVVVEYTKPGKGGMAHDKTEGTFVAAMRRANYPLHYTAFTALTGRSRALYLTRFNSFEEMQNANKIYDAPATASEFDRINAADGELLEETHTVVFSYDADLSYHAKPPSPQSRLLEAVIFQVHPGHVKDFEDLVKMYAGLLDKAGSVKHWGAYRVEYGESVDEFVLLTSSQSAADIDQRFAEDPKIMAGIGDEDRKKFSELSAAAIESEHVEAYEVNPTQSYVDDDWIKADPKFWKPKPQANTAAQ
jgi:hypothetical protein